MAVSVSVPDQMLVLSGTVQDITYVDYVTPEGMSCFAVTVSVENPGSLTEGMAATCWISGSTGEIYAADDGTLGVALWNSAKVEREFTVDFGKAAKSIKLAADEAGFVHN